MKDLLKVITKIGEITFKVLWIAWVIVIVGICSVTCLCALPFAYLANDDELFAQIVYAAAKMVTLPDKLVKGAFDVENAKTPIDGLTVKDIMEELKKSSGL